MDGYIDVANTMHIRTIDFTLNDYLFCLQVVVGESPAIAYANTYDVAEFKRTINTEDEDAYLARMQKCAELQLTQQSCKHLIEIIGTSYKSDIQSQASNLQDYRFTGEDIQKLLHNLLHERSEILSEASVRDIISLIKSLYESGAIESSGDWSKHFISIPTKYNAMCPTCNRELSICEGLDIRCECGQVFRWSESERRFYPQYSKL